MTNIGQTLRAAREEQDLSLDDVVAVTRIRAHFLEALEQDDFDALGGEIYVRGFLRNYATFLGLDPDPLLAPFRSQEHKLPVYKPSTQPRYLAEPLQSNPLPIGRILFMLFVLILLGVVGFSVWVRPTSLGSILAFLPNQEQSSSPSASPIQPIAVQEDDATEEVVPEEESETTEEVVSEEESEATEQVLSEEPTEAVEPTEPVEPTTQADATEPSEPALAEEPSTPTETVAAPSATVTNEPSPTVQDVATAVPTATLPARTRTPAATDALPTETPKPEPTATTQADEGLVIQAQILADTWLRVFVDNESASAIQQTAAPGESFEWIGQESVNIRAGNGAAINLTVNGQEYGPLGGSGQVVDLRWERDVEGGSPVLVQQ